MDRRRVVISVLFVFLLALIVGGLFGANVYFARRIQGGEDFLLPWIGARGFLIEKIDPYSVDITHEVQTIYHQHQANKNEYPFRMDYPFYILVLFFPLAYIGEISLARGFWMMLLEGALITTVMLNIAVTDWRPRRVTLILFLLFCLFGFYSIYSIIQGNVTIIFALLFGGILVALREGKDEVAGGLLALITYKWEVSGLFMVFVFIWTLSQHRWRVLMVFLMTLAVMVFVATIIFPSWPLPFLSSVVTNLRTSHGWTPGAIFQKLWPGIGDKLSWALTLTLFGILILEWRAVRGKEFRQFLWVTCLTLTATPLLGIPADPANFIVLFLPLALVFTVMEERWGHFGRWSVAAAIFLLMSLWLIIFCIVSEGNSSLETVIFLPLPLLLLLALYWIRWWIIRPPRTWVDRIVESGNR